MDKYLYVMLMENVAPLNAPAVERHIAHLRALDEQGALVLCGPFTGGAGGMVVLRAPSLARADEMARADPFISGGYKSYRLLTLEPANAENGYLPD